MLLEIPNHLIIETSWIAERTQQTIDEILLQTIASNLHYQTSLLNSQQEMLKGDVVVKTLQELDKYAD
jgi:hypothetical protein